MFTTRNARTPRRRRGMILMVVLALLTLFAILGISFVLVAQSQETSARIARESETHFKPDIDPEAAFFYALGKILYDDKNDDTGVYSALRGHSLARNMWGWYDATENKAPDAGKVDNSKPVLNDKAFAGHGRLSFGLQGFGPTTGNPNPNDITLINYMYFKDAANYNKLRDPERYPLPDPTSGNPRFRGAPGDKFDPEVQAYIPSGSVPYTYPDHNNLCLAAINPANGQIACPSFHRPYLFPLNNTSDPLWTDVNQPGILRTLRPHPLYHKPTTGPSNFPNPIDGGGDVKNLDGVPGGADSIWIDIGAPVMRSNDGRKYKMLIAPLILDLDGRIDLNVIGNLMGKNPTSGDQEHRSNQGWGAWEINPQKVLNNDASEWRNLLNGSSISQARYPGRYDTNNPAPPPPPPVQPDRRRVPFGPALPGGGTGSSVRGWARIDYNGAKDYPGGMPDRKGHPSDALLLPSHSASPYTSFPDFGTPGPGTERGYRSGAPLTGVTSPPFTDDTAYNPTDSENKDHASIYWPYNPRSGVSGDQGKNYRFPIKDMVRVLRDGGSGADMIPSDLRGLIKGNLWSGGKRRNLVTLLSADLDRPGATPYIWDRLATGTMVAGTTDHVETRYKYARLLDPMMNPTPIWSFANNSGIPFPDPRTFRLRTDAKGSEFDTAVDAGTMPASIATNTWRHGLKVNGLPGELRNRLNLDRNLPEYPTPNADGFVATDATAVVDPTPPTPEQANYRQLQAAKTARQTFADEIWKVLRAVTGAGDPTQLADTTTTPPGPGTTSPEFHAVRALAQLAVNIVDYIDNDDNSTVFTITYTEGMMTRTERFYGFELPRLVINEVYAQYDNENGSLTGNQVDPMKNYCVNTWVELMNPMFDDRDTHKKVSLLDTTARLSKLESGGMTRPIYRIILCEAPAMAMAANDVMRQPDNTTGDPLFNAPMTDPRSIMQDWGAGVTSVQPMLATNRFNDAALTNTGFHLVGPLPKGANPEDLFTDPGGVETDPIFKADYPQMHETRDMQLKIRVDTRPDTEFPRLRVVLQRLAIPTLPLQEVPAQEATLGYFNPFITVDYISDFRGPDPSSPDPNNPTPVTLIQDGRLYDRNGPVATAPPILENRVSAGRTQPYAANWLQWKKAVTPNPVVVNKPATTFYRQNSKAATAADLQTRSNITTAMDPTTDPTYEPNLKLPFDWLIHLDRKLINPFEVWHVSAAGPWLTTQDFVQQTGLVGAQIVDPDPMRIFREAIPANQHAAPWGVEKARLYRFFEFVTIPPRSSFDSLNATEANNVPDTATKRLPPLPLDRVMGKVNINTVWNRDIFRALADAQPANAFYDTRTAAPVNTDSYVDVVFDQVLASRSKSSTGANGDYTPNLKPTDTNLASALGLATAAGDLDRPFWGFGIGYGASAGTDYPNSLEIFAGRKYSDNNTMVTGINDTLFRGTLFDTPSPDQTTWTSPGVRPNQHAYQKKELLRKIFGNLTTRSNVFGVWLTVGFFEVEDDAVRPVKLGKEMNKAENRHVRHRMFAIVDRTQMNAFSTTSSDDFAGFTAGSEREVKLPWVTKTGPPAEPPPYKILDPRTGREWEVKDDVYLTYSPDKDYAETVRVTISGTPARPRVFFQRNHGNNCKVICRGNPGPMSRYNPRDDGDVVPFFMLID